MIKNKKIIKAFSLLLLITCTFTFNYKYVAADINLNITGNISDVVNNNLVGGNTAVGGTNEPPAYGSQCDRVSCKVGYSASASVRVNIDAKKPDGTIIKDDLLQPNFSTEFLAGTPIMLKVYETQEYTITASYSVSAKRQVWTCKVYRDVCISRNKKGDCTATQKILHYQYDSECSCPSGEASFKEWKDVTSEYIASCSAAAVPPSISLTPLYTVSYRDSNDIDAKESSDKYYTATTVKGGKCSEPNRYSTPGITNANGYSSSNNVHSRCDVSYDRDEKVCINVKNGKVRYINKNKECEIPDEYTVTEDEDGFWKYFIPLNANSADDFVFTLNSSLQKLGKALCEQAIDKYDHYPYIITDSNGNSFIGQNLSKEKAKKMVANGCYLQTTAVIPVKQRFYNELENGKNFKGFNFYYKPIDINDPFPNGINEVSLWYEWNKNKKDPDLTKSYNQITYVSKISDVDDIREYTKDNPYTNWYTMYVNGSSSFIENSEIITRYVNRNSYYPLGCGPINENEYTDASKKVKNVFYQKECSK